VVMRDGHASTEARLRASRARLLAGADAERREIERALHDGIQQDLVALAVKLQLARRLARSEPAAAQQLFDEIEGDLQDALDAVRGLSERVLSPLLESRGLREALLGAAATAGVSVRIEAEDLVRYPPELERALYFCCREALLGAAASGVRLTLRIWEQNDALNFEVVGEGGNSAVEKSKLQHLEDRIDTLGGRLTVVTESPAMRVCATIPFS
jgi:signal transduction histidine kinase